MRLQPIIVALAIIIEQINVGLSSASVESKHLVRGTRTINDDSNVHHRSSTHDFEMGAVDPVAVHDLPHCHNLTKKWAGNCRLASM